MPSYTQDWIGNSFSGLNNKHVQNFISAIHIHPDGTAYTTSTFDEGAYECGVYNGDALGRLEGMHLSDKLAGSAITSTSGTGGNVYLACIQFSQGTGDIPPTGSTWACVRRYNRGNFTPSTYSNGRGNGQSLLIVNETTIPRTDVNYPHVTGLTFKNDVLYICTAATNTVSIATAINTAVTITSSFTTTSPDKIEIDSANNLWITRRKSGAIPGQVDKYTTSGTLLLSITANIEDPVDLAFDSKGRLYVADNGIKQQCLIFDVTTTPSAPFQVGTVGIEKGIYAEPKGLISPLRFYGITGIGFDSADNFYIACGSRIERSVSDLRKISPKGELIWNMQSLFFTDVIDASQEFYGQEYYGVHELIKYDHNKPQGKAWKHKAYTLDPYTYPLDPRLQIGFNNQPTGRQFNSVWTRDFGGRKYIYMTNMFNSFLYWWKSVPDSYIISPSGSFVTHSPSDIFPPNAPADTEYFWRDASGTATYAANEFISNPDDYPFMGGYWVDSQLGIWKTLRLNTNNIRYHPCLGIDRFGNPIYDFASRITYNTPFAFEPRRVEYFPDSDTMYLTGITTENPATHDDARVIGTEIMRFDGWKAGTRTLRYRTAVPGNTVAEPGKTLLPASIATIDNKYSFVARNKLNLVNVYNAKTGAFVQEMATDDAVFGTAVNVGWVDLPYSLTAHVRKLSKNEEEYICIREENLFGKNIIFKFKP